jgi:hypothetical protein
MKFFKPMSPNEKTNWNKSAVLGFYTFMGLLCVNYISSLISGSGTSFPQLSSSLPD